MTPIGENGLIYPELSYKICGLGFKVHNDLGRYRNEKQYGDAFENLLKGHGISYKREFALEVSFNGEKPRRCIVDFIVEDKIVIEFKAREAVLKDDYFQILRYLVSCNKKLGIVFNFRQKYLRPKRVLNNEYVKPY